MLTWEDDLELHALRKRGWTITAIANHAKLDRKTVRKYLAGDGTPGVRARPGLRGTRLVVQSLCELGLVGCGPL